MVDRETEYDLRPYVTKAGTGKLFRSPKNTIPDRARFPRGFTPDRLREVSEAVGDVEYRQPGTLAPIQQHVEKRYFSFPASHQVSAQGDITNHPESRLITRGGLSNRQKQEAGEGAASIRESLARSTVPTEMMEKTTFSVTPDLPYNGVYFPGEQRLHFGRQQQDVDAYTAAKIPEEESLRGKTVIHEMGHAADARLANPPQDRNDIAWASASPGQLEEFADDYMFEHYQPDPRAERAGRTYGATTSYPGRNPDYNPPEQYEGYGKWGERSQMAAQEIGARMSRTGNNTPTTPKQREFIVNEGMVNHALQRGQFAAQERGEVPREETWVQPEMQGFGQISRAAKRQ